MIEEFKDVIVSIFESEGKVINRDNITLLMYQSGGGYIVALFGTTLPSNQYYNLIYDASKDEISFAIYEKTKIGRASTK